jgi:hypothetical protein
MNISLLLINMIETILNLFGYTYRKEPSLLLMHMLDVTHESYLGSLKRQNRIMDFLANKA